MWKPSPSPSRSTRSAGNIHRFFPFHRLLKLLAGVGLLLQLAILSYNHWSGYHVLAGPEEFLLRLLRGMGMTLFAGFLVAYPDLFLIRRLNRVLPWKQKALRRIPLQLLFSIGLAFLISMAVTLLFHWISPYREDFRGVLLNNALIYGVVNLLLMVLLEAWIHYAQSQEAEEVARTLEKELSQIKFEVLRSQINPHFLFNSLNALSGLIDTDVKKAQLFIEEFSQIYRYVLETIEQPVALLEKELDFMRSYLFLQQIRYGESLRFTVDVSSPCLNRVLPPLSLQVVLENAIKHNIITDDRPLTISVTCRTDCLEVRNNIQPKISRPSSTGLGLKNLTRRYAMISDREPLFSVETKHYLARLPLIEPEQDEHPDRRR
ncbi:MAG: histidine kinase [Bacteroidales bacterium]